MSILRCYYCNKEIIPDAEGNITVAWINEIQSTTVDMPYCNSDCVQKIKLKHRLIFPNTEKEKQWFLEIIAKEKQDEYKRHLEYLDKLKEEIKCFIK